MKTAFDPRALTPEAHAALYDAARRDALALRAAAISRAFDMLVQAVHAPSRQRPRPAVAST